MGKNGWKLRRKGYIFKVFRGKLEILFYKE